ncbi:hypothetical protein GFI45_17880 [Salmonella enterica subsp. enterica]|nr:hypothetical protein [Salmonella enterica subsp. enterica serovar Gombe]EDJ9086907.1 hypothetical protein [Salmonella enterica subsp. enterica serovar Vitkin]
MASLADICEKNFIIIMHSRPKKLTPPEELKQMRAQFISIREACERVREEYPEMTNKEAIEWILGKAFGKTRPVKHLFAGHTVSMPPEDIKKAVTNDDKWVDSYGFIRADLERALGMGLSASSLAICHQDNVYFEVVRNGEPEGAKPPPADIAGNSKSLANEEIDFEPDAKGSTESDMIAAFAFGLAENSATYRKKNGGVNVSEVVRHAQRNLAKRGGEFTVGDRTLRKIVARSIKKYTPDLENEADQNEKPH